MPSRQPFTARRYAPLLEGCKQLLSLIRRRGLMSQLPQRATTVAGYFCRLRRLVRWMDTEGFNLFSQLDRDALLRFRGTIAKGKNHTATAVSPATIQCYLNLFAYLYLYRNELSDGLSTDLFAGETVSELSGAHQDYRLHRHVYTPDAMAVPLIQGAIDCLTTSAIDILRAREVYASAITDAQRRGRSTQACNCRALRALRNVKIATPRGPKRILSVLDLSSLLDMLYAACLVVISYLVGPRISEIQHLLTGCVQPRAGV